MLRARGLINCTSGQKTRLPPDKMHEGNSSNHNLNLRGFSELSRTIFSDINEYLKPQTRGLHLILNPL